MKKPRKRRNLVTLDMLLTRKGGPMKDRRSKRLSRRRIKEESIREESS